MPQKITLENLAKKIDDLALGMRQGFKEGKDYTDKKIDMLALIVKKGFDAVDERFEGVDERFEGVEKKLDNLERGQEDIKIRLDQVAYRFEVQELDRRLTRVEAKLRMET